MIEQKIQAFVDERARRLSVARRCLKAGQSLKEAARAAGMSASELDLELWNAMGRR